MPGMPDMTRERFDRVPDPISARCISLSDCLMSGLAVSGFKLPSLLRFDRKVRGGEDPVMARSPRSLFGVARAPPDAHMGHAHARASWRGRPAVPAPVLHRASRGPAAGRGSGQLARARPFPMAVDGTGHHSSRKVKCKDRRAGNHRDGTKTYCHRTLGAAIVHPDLKEVPPPGPEPIRNDDGAERNDRERNASRRPVSAGSART